MILVDFWINITLEIITYKFPNSEIKKHLWLLFFPMFDPLSRWVEHRKKRSQRWFLISDLGNLKVTHSKGFYLQMAPTIGLLDQSTQCWSYPKLENFSKLKNLNGPKWTLNVLNWLLMVQIDQSKFFQFYIKKNPIEP